MPTYKAPVESALFLLRDVLGYERYSNLPGFADAPLDTVEAVLTEAARFTEEVLQPLNRVGDKEGCKRHDDGSRHDAEGLQARPTRASSKQAGSGSAADPEYGGQGLPYVLAAIVNEFTTSANMSFGMYPGLIAGRDRRARRCTARRSRRRSICQNSSRANGRAR